MSPTARHRPTGNRRRRLREPVMMGLVAAAALVPLAAAPTAQAAAILPDGTTVRTLSPVRGNYVNNTLMGVECQAPKVCTPIKYPSFVTASGVSRLDAVLKGDVVPGTVIFAYSNGAQVATHWIAEHADDPDAPPAADVTFVLMGNSLRAHGGVDAEFGISQPSQYQVIDIAREYDPVADYPDDHLNFLAVANALAGSQSIHDYRPVDINDPDNIVWTEGNITYVLVPTENLPLLDGLRRIGLNDLADKMQVTLKPKIDAAYDRSYIPASALTPTNSAALGIDAPAVAVSSSAAPKADAVTSPAPARGKEIRAGRHQRADTDVSSAANRADDGKKSTALTRATDQLKHLSTSLRPSNRSQARHSTSGDDGKQSSKSASSE